MPLQLRIPILLLVGLLPAGIIFYGFYVGEKNIEVASTGLNSSSKGLFGWDYSFVEHTFELEGETYHPVIIDSGRGIRPKELVSEIILCVCLGWGLTFGVGALIRAFALDPRAIRYPAKDKF